MDLWVMILILTVAYFCVIAIFDLWLRPTPEVHWILDSDDPVAQMPRDSTLADLPQRRGVGPGWLRL